MSKLEAEADAARGAFAQLTSSRAASPWSRSAAKGEVALITEYDASQPENLGGPSRRSSRWCSTSVERRQIHAPGGSVAIRSFTNARRVSRSIADTGIGIPPEVLPHLFAPFARGDNSVSRQFPAPGFRAWPLVAD